MKKIEIKRIGLACFFLLGITGFAFSQNKVTVKDVFTVLDGNFQKYPWVIPIQVSRTDDSRSSSVKLNRLTYDTTVETEHGDEPITQKAEVIYVEVIQNGWRYNLKLDFSPKKEKGAEHSETVKRRIYKNVLADIIPPAEAGS